MKKDVMVDSCVLILLARTGRLDLLKYFGNVYITPQIYEEVAGDGMELPGSDEIRDACRNWIKTIDSPAKTASKKGIKGGGNASDAVDVESRIGESDASIIRLAGRKHTILLSNDHALIKIARSKDIDCWWMTTLLLKLAKEKKLTKREAKDLLYDLVQNGMRLRIEVYAAIERRIGEM